MKLLFPNSRLRICFWLSLLLVTAPVLSAQDAVPKTEPAKVDASPVADIAGETHDGKAVALSDYLGKVVLIDFWGTW